MRPQRTFCFTFDADWIPGSGPGYERILTLCAQYSLRPTVYVTGRFAEDYPDLVRESARRGHDIGSHGWQHPQDVEEDFGAGTSEQQRVWLDRGTEAIERICGVRVHSFRAPNLRIHERTLTVLEDAGFDTDSSVPARRFDLGYGQVSKLKYFAAPLRPYRLSHEHLAADGASAVVEVPPSSLIVPLNMSALRKLGLPIIKQVIARLTRRTSVLVFYAHPVEFEQYEKQKLAADTPARYRSGLGPQNIPLAAALVEYLLSIGYVSQSIADVRAEYLHMNPVVAEIA